MGDHQNNLLGVKRAILKKTTTANIVIGLPSSFSDNPSLKIFVMSDSYCGLDQELSHDLQQYVN